MIEITLIFLEEILFTVMNKVVNSMS